MTHYEKQSSKELRAGMGEGLVEAGRKNENVVALSADVKGSVKMDGFAKEFPERFIQCGIAEANMVGIAAGLSLCGKVPFIGGFAEFVTGRVYDQIRQVVCYSNKNVKICGSHAGISLGEDGATHQTMEDIALMKVLPNMTVLVPADFNQAKAATLAAAEHVGPVYLRLGRSKMPCFLPEDEKFEIGKAQLLSEGTDVTLFACGHLVWEALQAAEMLEKVGISGSPAGRRDAREGRHQLRSHQYPHHQAARRGGHRGQRPQDRRRRHLRRAPLQRRPRRQRGPDPRSPLPHPNGVRGCGR